MPAGHTAHVSSRGEGYGRYSYSYSCTCGARGGRYSDRARAQAAAGRHEANPGRQPSIRIPAN